MFTITKLVDIGETMRLQRCSDMMNNIFSEIRNCLLAIDFKHIFLQRERKISVNGHLWGTVIFSRIRLNYWINIAVNDRRQATSICWLNFNLPEDDRFLGISLLESFSILSEHLIESLSDVLKFQLVPPECEKFFKDIKSS